MPFERSPSMRQRLSLEDSRSRLPPRVLALGSLLSTPGCRDDSDPFAILKSVILATKTVLAQCRSHAASADHRCARVPALSAHVVHDFRFDLVLGQIQREDRFRSKRVCSRRRLGMVKTTCRCATGRQTSSATWIAVSNARFWWQDGQAGTVAQRTRANPSCRSPHLRKAATDCSTMPRQ